LGVGGWSEGREGNSQGADEGLHVMGGTGAEPGAERG
jgi:hypothetical protein